MVTADLSLTSNALKEVRTDSEDAKSYWKVEHSIAIQFGGIELQAFLEWVDAVSLWYLLCIPCLFNSMSRMTSWSGPRL